MKRVLLVTLAVSLLLLIPALGIIRGCSHRHNAMMIELFPDKYYAYVHTTGAHPVTWSEFARWFEGNGTPLGWTAEDLSATFRLPVEAADGRLLIIAPRYTDLQEYVDRRMSEASRPNFKADWSGDNSRQDETQPD
ncbi:hypothetical protein H5P28_08870 [Ruficoccus amylovorans]|uniref:Uncharacterized protein n=1 Tax=Ruficoccus amylovorans TaxID=1804625 RepID=A0A842HFL6_9BACT|nr:hypothetical protein [Ruficoccus amylovorans]MBC2594367.1 hypothetical protein [Ruficoccus amylovorans]